MQCKLLGSRFLLMGHRPFVESQASIGHTFDISQHSSTDDGCGSGGGISIESELAVGIIGGPVNGIKWCI